MIGKPITGSLPVHTLCVTDVGVEYQVVFPNPNALGVEQYSIPPNTKVLSSVSPGWTQWYRLLLYLVFIS